MSAARTRVKICGVRTPEQALMVAEAGADAVGLVFHEPSPRHVTAEQAERIASVLPPFVCAVGLFVNAPASFVRAVCTQVPLSLLQFHGDETFDECAQFDKPFVRAVRVRPGVDLLQFKSGMVPHRHLARGLLVDAYVPGTHGGTGRSFDWGLLPEALRGEIILSGGLGPDNVREAVTRVRPWAVDVSSGVERSPGVKDPERVTRFIEEVRLADV
jgi:phosphoribosylanthranilate isomerase